MMNSSENIMNKDKPKALIIGILDEGRYAYFNAGLSHHYKTTVFYTNKRHNSLLDQWRRLPPDLYRWQYSKDCRFLPGYSAGDVLNIDDNYYDIIVVQNLAAQNIGKINDRKKALDFLKKLKKKTKKLYWAELGEIFYFSFGSPEFWEMIDGVIKGYVFKKEYACYIRDEKAMAKYEWFNNPALFEPLIRENRNLKIENYYHKIMPCGYPSSITDKPALTWLDNKRIYDIAGNFQGNAGLRFAVTKMLEERLKDKYIYSFDYGKGGWLTSKKHVKNVLNPYLIKKFNIGRILFHLKYGKYFYPKPLYFHNLANSKCYLGLGHYASSLRTADAMGSGCVLLNWNLDKFETGVPLIDDYNYVSVGKREDMTDDNFHLKEEYSDSIVEKVKSILDDEKKQKEIIKNQIETYKEYFITPQQFIKKIFIEKIKHAR